MPTPSDTPAILVVVRGDGAEAVVGQLPARSPDLALIDTIARTALRVQRCGYRLRLHRVSPSLYELLDLAGLAALLVFDSPDVDGPTV